MTSPRALLVIALLLPFLAAAPRPRPAAATDDAPGVPSSIHHYEMVQMEAPGVARAAEQAVLSLSTLGRQFDVQLEPADLFASGARVVWDDGDTRFEEPPAGVGQFFRGHLVGEPGSWARLRLDGGELMGIVASAGELYFFEPARHFFGPAAVGQSVAYRLSDTDPLPLGACAAHGPPQRSFAGARTVLPGKVWPRGVSREPAAPAHPGGAAGTALTVSALAEIGMVADYQYFNKHLGDSAADIAALINAVDGIYEADVGVTLRIRSTIVYTAAADPFSETTDYGALLNEFSTFHDANDDTPSQILYGADVAHLMTGRDLDGSIIGVAWMSGLCASFWGSALSQDFTTNFYVMTLLVGHEMGHNFGAPHDNESGSPCASTPGLYIMNPMLSSSLLQEFSACSQTQMADDVGAASCLDPYTPGPTPTPTATLAPTPTPTVVPLTLAPITSPIVVGSPLTLTGTGFTAGSVMRIFVATATGAVGYGPYAPTARTSTSLTFNPLSASIPLGNGFASVLIVNTDQGYVTSNPQSALLAGNAALNIPTITAIGGVAVRPMDPTIPLATVETVVVQGTTVAIAGTGFNRPLVNLFTAAGNQGPLTPLPGGTSTQLGVVIPAGTPTGPGSFQVVNGPYTGNVLSNAVSVPIGSMVTVDSVSQQGTTVTVTGTGFSRLSVINLFAQGSTGGVVNLGGLSSGGGSRIPLTIVDSTRFTFAVPASGAVTGPAFVQVLNPPFITYSSSCNDPDGAFTMIVP